MTRAYKNAYENFQKNDKAIKRLADLVTLQKINQNQIDANFQIDSKKNKQNDKNDKKKSCVYDQVHHFKKCLYIVLENRKLD